MLCRLLSFGPLLLLLLTVVSKLHNRDVNLLKDNTVAILFKIFGRMNDHINFFHRGFKQEVTEQQVSYHLEVFFSGDESCLSDNFVEILAWIYLNAQGVENQNQSFCVFEHCLLAMS